MANFKTHLLIGGSTASIAYFLYARAHRENITFEDVLKAFVIGAAFGVLPDVLEQPTSPYHRKFFHSLAVLAREVYGISKLPGSSLDSESKKSTLAALSGYGSHLLLDSGTPAGLPLIG